MPIEIDGATRRSFVFPAPLDKAFAFYSELDTIFTCLPHISIVEKYSETGFRLIYNTLELGIYSIRIVCDLEAQLDNQTHLLRISPLEGTDRVQSIFSLRSIQAQGYYSSESRFIPFGDSTRIDYSLRIQASLPTPLAALYMLPSLRNSIASRITTWRIEEIAGGFIERSIRKYHQA
jgi:hypothetical protein